MAYTIDVHLSPDEVRSQMRADALKGLQGEKKSIPPVWFYDERGSRLFEEITQLPEYYPTRAERALLEEHARSIAELAKADTLVELGAGACDKTRVLLTALQEAGTLSRYVPFDVSDEFLRSAAHDPLRRNSTPSTSTWSSGTSTITWPRSRPTGGGMVAFLGGTIGNLDPAQRARFLFDLNCTMSSDDSLAPRHGPGQGPRPPGGGLRRRRRRHGGLQSQRAPRAQRAARRGLRCPDRFRHVALWNEDEQWIEMRLRAEEATEVYADGCRHHRAASRRARTS